MIRWEEKEDKEEAVENSFVMRKMYKYKDESSREKKKVGEEKMRK